MAQISPCSLLRRESLLITKRIDDIHKRCHAVLGNVLIDELPAMIAMLAVTATIRQTGYHRVPNIVRILHVSSGPGYHDAAGRAAHFD